MNYWSPDTLLNDQVIQGAIDYFQARTDNPVIGVYSVRSMWNQIAGSHYQPGVPTWVAGALSLLSAPLYCSGTSFTGGHYVLVQHWTGLLDEDYAC